MTIELTPEFQIYLENEVKDNIEHLLFTRDTIVITTNTNIYLLDYKDIDY